MNAYLNQLCLLTLSPWLQAEDAQAKLLPNAAAIDSIWELVNETALRLANTRIVLISTEAIDKELRVPQEGIEIPG